MLSKMNFTQFEVIEKPTVCAVGTELLGNFCMGPYSR